jgi:hypothetical protein
MLKFKEKKKGEHGGWRLKISVRRALSRIIRVELKR